MTRHKPGASYAKSGRKRTQIVLWGTLPPCSSNCLPPWPPWPKRRKGCWKSKRSRAGVLCLRHVHGPLYIVPAAGPALRHTHGAWKRRWNPRPFHFIPTTAGRSWTLSRRPSRKGSSSTKSIESIAREIINFDGCTAAAACNSTAKDCRTACWVPCRMYRAQAGRRGPATGP